MDYEIVEMPAFRVTGIAMRASNDDPAAIGDHWRRFMREPLRSVLKPIEEAPYAVYFDYAGDHTQPYTLLLGYRVADDVAAPPDLVSHPIHAAKYAHISREGPMPATIIEAWQEVWAAGLNRAYVADFERYPSQETVEVYLGIL